MQGTAANVMRSHPHVGNGVLCGGRERTRRQRAEDEAKTQP